jgi:hypothetical protein
MHQLFRRDLADDLVLHLDVADRLLLHLLMGRLKKNH